MFFLLLLDGYLGSLGFSLARLTGLDLVEYETKFFGDGEFYFRVKSNVVGKNVFVLLSMFPEPSFSVIRGLFFVNTLKDLGASRVTLITPYLAYSRQDRRFLDGECVSSRVVVNSFLSVGADYVVSIDVHNPNAFTDLGEKFVNLSSMPVISQFIRENYSKSDVFLVSPDKGRVEYVKGISDTIGVPFLYFKKRRDLRTGAIIKHEVSDESLFKQLINEKKVAIILDDIISTGGTISNIARTIRENGFTGDIVTVFTHGLFLPGSLVKLYKSGVTEVVSTDTVKNPFERISVAPIIRDFIKRLENK